MSVKIVTIVQARTGSSRLPGKSLRALCGKPMVLHVMARAAAMGHETWLATSGEATDNLLAETVSMAKYPVFRGSERDVLGRMRRCARFTGADIVVRVTGDCPCFVPEIGNEVVQLYLDHAGGIATNDTTTSGFPDGLDCEVFSYGLIAAMDDTLLVPASAKDELWRDREHVTLRMREASHHRILRCTEDWSRTKLSVDSLEDFEAVRRVLGRIPVHEMGWDELRAAMVAEQSAGIDRMRGDL